MENKKNSLGYLGIEFQYRLVHHIMDDNKFFADINDIVDNNMFTDANLRRFVGTLQDYYRKYDCTPSYEQLEIELRGNSNGTEQEIEFIQATVEKIKDTTCEGADSVKSKAQKFFRQQNFVKFNNKITELLKAGDIERFEELEELWQKALSAGNRDEIGISLRDNLGDVLAEDYRKVVPTGINGIDESLEGGLGKGELGVIIAGSGFGKTSLTTSMANHAASKGFKVVQIVFEDKEKKIQRKHIGKITNIEARNLSKQENKEFVMDVMKNCDIFDNTLKIKKFNTGEITPVHIRNYLKRLINIGFKPDLVIIDYFECLISTKNFKDPWSGEAHTMRQLETISSDLEVALWVPTQGTKGSLNADIITMDKAGGSVGKIQIGHIILSISRSLEDASNNIATIAVLKNRAGSSGKIMEGIYFNNGTCVINTDNAKSYNDMSEYRDEEENKQQELMKNLLNKGIRNRSVKENKMDEEIF